ncbi:MAG: hypothetical protein ACP5NB_11670, partial [Chloroflexia bacterium]
FTARKEEINFVLKAVEEWARRPRGRAIRFTGPKGSGKSWLLCEIRRRLQESFPAIAVRHLILGEDRPCQEAFYLPPSRLGEYQAAHTDDILSYLAEPLGLSDLPVPIDERSSFLEERYARSGRPPVLLVDGVDELPLEFALNYLEQYVLGPFLKVGALVVLGGRLPKSTENWASIALRGAEERVLSPFGPPEAEEQLQKRGFPLPVSVGDIVQRGSGYPLANLLLAEELRAGKTWGEALRAVADRFLQSVPPSARGDFQDLCILAGFNVEEMAELLSRPPGDYRLRLNEFLATRLVRWEGEKRDVEMGSGESLQVEKEYVMDEAVRRVLEESLRENDPAHWQALHRAAFNLYEGWAEKYPSNRWQQRQDYHRKRFPPLSGSGSTEVHGQKSHANEEEKRWNGLYPMPVSG